MSAGRARLVVVSSLGWALALSVCWSTHAHGRGKQSTPPRAALPDSGALAVFVADSASGAPLHWALVFVKGPYWWKSDQRSVASATDSTGWARFAQLESGNYEVRVCHEKYGRDDGRLVFIRAGRADSIRVGLPYLGPPPDGRIRCD